jgi:hypothetical protein
MVCGIISIYHNVVFVSEACFLSGRLIKFYCIEIKSKHFFLKLVTVRNEQLKVMTRFDSFMSSHNIYEKVLNILN